MKKTVIMGRESVRGFKKYSLFFITVLLFAFCLPTSSQAQPPSGGFPGGGMLQKQERLQTLITMRLVSELGLTQEQALKVSEIMKKHQMKRRELRQKMHFLDQQLRTVAYSNDPKQASQVVSDIQKTKDELDGIDDAMFKEVKPMLTPQQQAKFLLVMQDIRKEMMQFRRGGGPGMGGPPPGGNLPPSK